jgi:hypothetical protein
MTPTWKWMNASDLMRDAARGWQTWAWARLQARTGKSRVFLYYFDQHPKRDPDLPQAGHGMPWTCRTFSRPSTGKTKN